MIVGLSGFARSGKDEAAKVLVEEFGFTRVAFADKLRQMLYELNPVTVANFEHHGMDPIGYNGVVFKLLQPVIDEYGWDGYKESPFSKDIRRLLQRLGTEAARKALWDTIWIDAAFAGVESDRIVVTDARFYNEFDAVRERGGSIWRIERAGVGPANDHASELEAISYPHFAVTIHNDGMLEDYHEKVREHARRL